MSHTGGYSAKTGVARWCTHDVFNPNTNPNPNRFERNARRLTLAVTDPQDAEEGSLTWEESQRILPGAADSPWLTPGAHGTPSDVTMEPVPVAPEEPEEPFVATQAPHWQDPPQVETPFEGQLGGMEVFCDRGSTVNPNT